MNSNFCRKFCGGTEFTDFRGAPLRGLRLGKTSVLLRALDLGVTGLFIYKAVKAKKAFTENCTEL